jgi:hypothetical protein
VFAAEVCSCDLRPTKSRVKAQHIYNGKRFLLETYLTHSIQHHVSQQQAEKLFESLYDGTHQAAWYDKSTVTEVEQAKEFARYLYKQIQWDAVKSEMRLFDEDVQLVGTCDALFRYGAVGSGTTVALCDWKITRKPMADAYQGAKMKGLLNHLEDS